MENAIWTTETNERMRGECQAELGGGGGILGRFNGGPSLLLLETEQVLIILEIGGDQRGGHTIGEAKLLMLEDKAYQLRGRDWRKEGQWRWASNRDIRGL